MNLGRVLSARQLRQGSLLDPVGPDTGQSGPGERRAGRGQNQRDSLEPEGHGRAKQMHPGRWREQQHADRDAHGTSPRQAQQQSPGTSDRGWHVADPASLRAIA